MFGKGKHDEIMGMLNKLTIINARVLVELREINQPMITVQGDMPSQSELDLAAKVLANEKPEKANKAWSRTDDAKLISLHREGLPFTEIALQLGRTLNAVKVRFSVLKKEGIFNV